MESVFRFKQFSLSHHRATMKVGTDAIVLGAWVPVADSCKRILDVGTGSGVIALMLAQRSQAHIHAIDIHEASVQEAAHNFANSPWSTRLKAIFSPLENFDPPENTKYDLIVSNPPFFQNSLLPRKTQLQLAKHNVALGMNDFVKYLSRLLDVDGEWAVILPVSVGATLQGIAKDFNFHIKNRVLIYSKKGKATNRVMLLFARKPVGDFNETHFVIRDAEGHYTEEYKSLCRDYHAEGYI